jgi:hypothetical protein
MAGAPDPRQGAETRTAAIVIVAAMVLWMAASWLGGAMDWPAKWAVLFDLAALAAFFWALVVLARVWRRRREDGED